MTKHVPTRSAFPAVLAALLHAVCAGVAHADCGLPNVEAAICPALVGFGASSEAMAISADGHTVVGRANQLPARWVDGEPASLGVIPPDAHSGMAHAVTSDGSHVIGCAPDNVASTNIFEWTANDGVFWLWDPRSWKCARDMSDDGQVLVGFGHDDGPPARWVNGVYEELHPGFGLSSASAVSGDGSVAVGYAVVGQTPTTYQFYYHAYRWDDSGAFDLMQTGWAGDRGSSGSAHGINPDGSIIVGSAQAPLATGPWPPNRPYRAIRWDEGIATFLDHTGFVGSNALDVSADGARIVGNLRDGTLSIAASWGSSGIPMILTDELSALGVDTAGWSLQEARAVSDDGRRIAGLGTRDGIAQGFVAVLGPTVGLDIRPGDATNRIPMALPNASLGLVVYGSDEIDVASYAQSDFSFGPAHAAVRFTTAPADLNGDGHFDRRLFVATHETGLVPADTRACLHAEGAEPFSVCSHVLVVQSACGIGFELALLLPILMRLRRRRAPGLAS